MCIYKAVGVRGGQGWPAPSLPPKFWLLMFFTINDSKKKLKKCYVLKTEILHRIRKRSFNRTSNIRITRLNLVYIIGTKQHSDCVFPSRLLGKATVYKQLALRWQIAWQLSGFNPLSFLSNNKNYRLRKTEVLPL